MTMIVIFNLVGVLFILLGVPLLLRRVPPNPLYGVRYRATLENEEIWYEINALGGRWLIGVGLGLILLPGALFFLDLASSPVLETAAVTWLLGGAILMCIVTYRAARRMAG